MQGQADVAAGGFVGRAGRRSGRVGTWLDSGGCAKLGPGVDGDTRQPDDSDHLCRNCSNQTGHCWEWCASSGARRSLGQGEGYGFVPVGYQRHQGAGQVPGDHVQGRRLRRQVHRPGRQGCYVRFRRY
uniref:(northern house mosquito) hypothetical protein n=1 Tax=Culex pipiens TaxID=7175 RepID=A0A8D8K6C0_CULPI